MLFEQKKVGVIHGRYYWKDFRILKCFVYHLGDNQTRPIAEDKFLMHLDEAF